MIGNETDAREALSNYDISDFSEVLSFDGTDRIVYLINGVVYKVETGGAIGVNANEYNNYLKVRDMVTDPIRVPKTTIFDIDGTGVIAMEYISGEAMAACYCIEGEEHYKCLPDDILEMVSPYIGDTGGMNVIANDKGYYIIDLAD